jgi:hypothetical protein
MSILFWLIISVLIMYPLKRWISAHVQGVAFLFTGNPRAAIWVYWVLFLPGTFLHEFSHWLTAKLLWVKTGSFSLWPHPKKGGELQMGAVQVEVSDPFRHSIIGVAPLIFGSVAILLIGQFQLALDQLGQALLSGDLTTLAHALAQTLAMPDVWLWLYLVFAISNAMLPSSSDRESWYTVLIYLGLTLALALGLGFNPGIAPQLQEIGQAIITYLLLAFMMTIAVDLFFILIIAGIELIFAQMAGRQVRYTR